MKSIFKGRKKWGKWLVGVAVLLAGCYYLGFAWPLRGGFFQAQRHGRPPLTPAWALECWLWEDDMNTAEYEMQLLEGYRAHDIPVRTLLIDSPWSLRYNDFQVDESRYPQPAAWFGQLQQQGYRVVLWMTSMVNSYSKDSRIRESETWYQQARQAGYLTGGGEQIRWWKGKGGFIDYTNPAAMQWWHGMQQPLFDWGIDGWKLDGTATLFRQQWAPLPVFYQRAAAGLMSTRQYMDHYYRDEYLHGLQQNPEFVTLSRSIDRWYHPEGFAPIDAAPVTWVGDQRHSWQSEGSPATAADQSDVAMDGIEGIEMAMDNILQAARLGYNIIGSDVAGFSGSHIPPRLYIRWAQFSAFCGLFLNGGHGNRALWERSPQELEIIRRYAWLHTELVPYLYAYVVQAHQGGRVLQQPLPRGRFHYTFGHHLLIAPIYRDELRREVHLPPGRWRYWFDDRQVLPGDTTFERSFPLEEYPVFIREGAIIPLHISRPYTGLGDSSYREFLTWLVYPDERPSHFTVYDEQNQQPTTLRAEAGPTELKLQFSGRRQPHILRIHLAQPPAFVSLDGRRLPAQAWQYNAQSQKLLIRTPAYSQGHYLIGK